MKTLDRYMLRRMAIAMAKCTVALVFMFVFIDLLTHRREDIMKYDVPWYIVIAYYVVMIPRVLCLYAAPLGMLVSTLLVFGSSVQDNEVTASLAGGISLRRFVLVPVLGALTFAAVLFGTQESVGAAATAQANRIERDYFSSRSFAAREGVSWANLGGHWTCHIAKFNRLALTGEGVRMYSVDDASISRIEAHRIYWDETKAQWILEDGMWYEFPNDTFDVIVKRISQTAAPFTECPDELLALDEPPDTKSARHLARDIHLAEGRGIPVQGYWTDYYVKYSQPALSFVMMVLAIPFALRLGRGGLATSFGISIVIAIVYLILFETAVNLGHAQRLAPILAAWLGNALFFAIGLVLFLRTHT